MDVFRICMLGELSVSYQDKQVQSTDTRSRKLWLLLAYLIYHRKTRIETQTLVDLLWGEEESSANPTNALKTLFHRLRSTLDQLGEGLGHQLILRRQGSYAFNPELKIELDIERFEALLRAAQSETDSAARLALSLHALGLYRGDFLPKYSAESWVLPISTYYHSLCIQLVSETLLLLREHNQPEKAVWLCRRALELEPYNEILYAELMRLLLSLGEQQSAVLVYESLSSLLASEFGVTPSDELRALHRDALRSTNESAVDLRSVTEEILLQSKQTGALYCDYDFFKAIYSAESRMAARNGVAMHVALLSVQTTSGKPLAKRSLARAMENLKPLICQFLRRGDIVARCSSSQYILLLPNANYENSCLVLERILRRFSQQYPHSPAFLRHSVQPLQPS